jgi:hypothetical protein
MRSLFLASIAIFGSTCTVPSSLSALELFGQAGVLGEWEVTADVTASGSKQEFAGPVTLKHTGICTTSEPEKRTGEIRIQMTGARIRASLNIEGNPCTYRAVKSDGFVGMMSCRDRRDVPMRLWVK